MNNTHTLTDIPCVLILIVDERERKRARSRDFSFVRKAANRIVLWTHVTNGRSAIAEQKEEYDA